MTLRIGILGAARVAVYAMIEPARMVAGVEVAAVAARDPVRAAAFAAQHGIAKVHRDYQELIDDADIDLIYIATPPSGHAELALAAIAAGKSALVEKPFAMNAGEAAHVQAATERAGVRVFEAMHSLHHALFARVLSVVAAGEIGVVREIEATFEAPIDPTDPLRWTSALGGGALMDLGIYPLAWVRRIAGEGFNVTRSEATIRDGVDARFTAQLDYPDGPACRIDASMIADVPLARLRLKGDAGELRVRNPLAPQLGNALTISSAAGERTEQIEGPSSYAAQLAAVRSTLIDDAPFPLPLDDHVASMTAIDRVRANWAHVAVG